MLTLEEVDKIVRRNLDCLDPTKYQIERQKWGDDVKYTLYNCGQFVGILRVGLDDYGKVQYGSIQHTDDPKLRAEWDRIWRDMIAAMVERAEKEKAEKFVQAVAINTTGVVVTDADYPKTPEEQKRQAEEAKRFRILRGIEKSEIHPATVDPSAGQVSNPSNLKDEWERMGEETKKNFRIAWKTYKGMCKEYNDDVLDGSPQKLQKPTIQEFRDRLIAEKKAWKRKMVGDRRLRQVIEWGEAGLIK